MLTYLTKNSLKQSRKEAYKLNSVFRFYKLTSYVLNDRFFCALMSVLNSTEIKRGVCLES